MYGWLARLIVDHVRIATALLVLLFLGTTIGVLWLRVDFSVKSFFSSNDPDAAYLTEYEERWQAGDPLLIVVSGQGSTLLTKDRLQRIDALGRAIAEIEGVESVASPTIIPVEVRRLGFKILPLPLLATAPDADMPAEKQAAWRERVQHDPRLVPSLLSDDGEWAALVVGLGIDLDDLVQVRPLVRRIEAVVVEHDAADDLGYAVGGVPAVRAHLLEVMLRDQAILVPVAGILIVVLLTFLFRSFRGVAVPTIAALAPTAMLFGLMGLTGEPIGLLSQIFIVLIPAIAFAMAIHLLARYREEILALGTDEPTHEQRRVAIVTSMQALGTACFLTTFTTVIGFLSCNLTRMEVLKSFGNYAAIGVAISWAVALLAMPVALWYHSHRDVPPPTGLYGRLGHALHWLAQGSVRRPWTVVALSGVIVALSLIAALRVTVDYSLTNVYGPKNPITIANQQVDQHLGGVLALEIDLRGSPGTFEDPAVLAELAAIEAELRSRPEVRQAYGLASYMAFASTLMGGPDQVPDDRGLVRRVYKYAGDMEGLNQVVTAEHDRSRLVIRTVDLGAAEFDVFATTLADEIDARVGSYGIDVHATGPSLLAYRGLAQVAGDLTSSLVAAAVLIAGLIALLFRSVRLGALSLVPNLVPMAMGYGALGVLGWSLDPAPAVVFSVALGLAVDSTIHVMSRFGEERKLGMPIREAVVAAVEHSGNAVIITDMILVVGFGVNAFSSFPANRTFGVLGAFILLVGLLSNLVLLPALLSVVYRERSPAVAGVSSVQAGMNGGSSSGRADAQQRR